MSIWRVTIEPLAPFFAGPHTRARKAGALVHSDTLHAALMNVAALTGSPVLEEAERLRVSSLFPFWKDIFFYPKPFLPPLAVEREGDQEQLKEWKSVRLVSEGLLRAWLERHVAEFREIDFSLGDLAVLKSELDGKPRLPSKVVLEELAPAAVVDRAGGGTTPYERRGLRVNTDKGCGVWFFVDLEGDSGPEFEKLITHLGEQGLGGERSVGYGRFDVLSIDPYGDVDLFSPVEDADAFLTLSLYLPTEQEVRAGVLEDPAAYDCALRGGWIHSISGSEQRKRGLRMCVEGSVFQKVGNEHGEVRDVRPESFTRHPVWRSGLAFAVPFRAAKGDVP